MCPTLEIPPPFPNMQSYFGNMVPCKKTVIAAEPTGISVTVQKNGFRIVNSLGDLHNRPAMESAPRKKKKLSENRRIKVCLNDERLPPSLGSSNVEDELCLPSRSTTNGLSNDDKPHDRCPNNESRGPAYNCDDSSDSLLEASSHHPSESAEAAELLIEASASDRFINQRRCFMTVDANSPNNPIFCSSNSRTVSVSSNLASMERSSSLTPAVLTDRSTSSGAANGSLPGASSWNQSSQQKTQQNKRTPLPVPDCQDPVKDSSSQSPSKHQYSSNEQQLRAAAEPDKTYQTTCCQLPFNGHIEDMKHFRVCQIVLLGVVLRGEHGSWMNDIDLDHSCVTRVVDYVIGSSCKGILLASKCMEELCRCKHMTELNFDFPPNCINIAFDIFIKWFLENSRQPDFRAILLTLSRLPKDHKNVIMIVMSFATMILKLPNKIYRKALCIKLLEILVNTLKLKPWEAVRTLLVFSVTPETKQSEILDLLSSLEVSQKSADKRQSTNQLYMSVSCLWHVNKTFVCPPELIFEVLEECLEQMPEDLKLTKDGIVSNLVKLPRHVLRKRYYLVDKFLIRYYPMNSEVVRAFRCSVLYGNDVSISFQDDRRPYESSRVKSTGPVNPKWSHWSVQEARTKGFDIVLKNSMKASPRQEANSVFKPMPDISLRAEMGEELSCTDCYTFLKNRSYKNPLRPMDIDADLECLVKFLRLEKFDRVTKIISSFDNPDKQNSLRQCIQTLEREFKHCNRAEIHRIVIEIFLCLPGSLSDDNSSKKAFACMLCSLVVEFYKDADYPTALKLIKCMRLVGVNHLEHVPEGIGENTFNVVCSDILLRVRLYREALRTLKYCHCLTFLCHPFDGRFTSDYFVLEVLVKNMFRRFLKERLAYQAMWIFRLIFSAQRDLHYPFDVGKYYEGIVFLSFIRDLKNPCAVGDGADLYITVDRVCGNTERFHSITYRSLLVELHRVNSPEDIKRRTLWICLQRKIYPDFSKGPISPLVLESNLAKEEISIYLKYYFTYFIDLNDFQGFAAQPLVVRFTESPPPDIKPFPVSNDIMKTPRTVPEALERLKTVLEEIHRELDAEYHEDHVTIPVEGMKKLLDGFER